MSDDALIDEDFREILVGARRSESGDVGAVGVKIGVKDRSQIGRLPVRFTGQEDGARPDKGLQVFHRSEWKRSSAKCVHRLAGVDVYSPEGV
jgi:hypothetical protein